ncbi:hypothetical protein [Microbacterium rhizomatis]|uniref:Uncharacterized protein n=1 Tax=Microbacterium rhizomatis TaxID=1631477 RepID=A0A5J5J224_9MICO|nr:hypothetical protein [Microbacterium rhizomatis]KAA9108427.1 hypothetical protein F6B43_13715 [Microbacterium rhizomatis]
MSVQPRYPLEVVHTLSTLELASRTLAEVVDRLVAIRSEASDLLAATDWQTASARLFHRRAAGWRGDLDALIDTARLLDDDVGIARGRALAAAWWAGV